MIVRSREGKDHLPCLVRLPIIVDGPLTGTMTSERLKCKPSRVSSTASSELSLVTGGPGPNRVATPRTLRWDVMDRVFGYGRIEGQLTQRESEAATPGAEAVAGTMQE